MSAVTKALWLIENRYLRDLTLDDIAEHVGVSWRCREVLGPSLIPPIGNS
jgi:hypothetical protein